MDLLHKLRTAEETARGSDGRAFPGDVHIDAILGPGEVSIAGRRTLMFGSTNYFGLTWDHETVAAAQDAIAQYGTSTTGSRTANGTLRLHADLERDIADWFGMRDALLFSTGYQATLSVVGGLCGITDVVVVDAESSDAIRDATCHTSARVVTFRHHSARSLADRLAALPRGPRNKLVVVEALDPVRGDAAPLKDIVDACRRHGAYLVVDEADSLGTLGATGLGCAEAQGVLHEVDFVVSSLANALASVGGVCVSDHDELRALHFLARPYVFTASGSPATVASARAAVRILRERPQLRERLRANSRQLREGVRAAGYRVNSTDAPFVSIFAGDERRGVALWRRLLAGGVYVDVIRPHTRSPDDWVLRASCSSAHSSEQIARAVDVFTRARDSGREVRWASPSMGILGARAPIGVELTPFVADVAEERE